MVTNHNRAFYYPDGGILCSQLKRRRGVGLCDFRKLECSSSCSLKLNLISNFKIQPNGLHHHSFEQILQYFDVFYHNLLVFSSDLSILNFSC